MTGAYICKNEFLAVNEIFGASYGKVNIERGSKFTKIGTIDFGKKVRLISPGKSLEILVKAKDLDKYFMEDTNADKV